MRNMNEDLQKLANAFFENLTIVRIEYGGIGLNPKRPFGNSNVEEDILEIIECEMESNSTIENKEDWGPCYSGEQIDYARNLYHNMLIPYLQSKYLRE